MKIKPIYLLFLMLIGLAACSSDTDCFIADTVTQVKVIKVGDKNYYVYLRISGFQEKEVFDELFFHKPEVDVCGKSNIPSVSDLHIDEGEGILSKLLINNNKLVAVYTKTKTRQTDFKNIPVEFEKSSGLAP